MNIKKALTYIAIGFALTVLDFHITIGKASVGILPAFLGYFLLFLAYDKLGDYVAEKNYLKWVALILAAFYLLVWVGDIFNKEEYATIYGLVSAVKQSLHIISGVYFFLLFGVLENIAQDYNVPKKKTVRRLKYINFGAVVFAALLSFIAELVPLTFTAIVAICGGLVGVIATIITIFVLFGFTKALASQDAQPQQA